MEETILEIINKLQNFAIIDSSDEIQIENSSSNDINIQIVPRITKKVFKKLK